MRMIFGEDTMFVVRSKIVETTKEVEKQKFADFHTGETSANIPVLEKAFMLVALTGTSMIEFHSAKRTITMFPSEVKIQVSTETIHYLINM